MENNKKELITRLIKEGKINIDEAMVLMDEYSGSGRSVNLTPTLNVPLDLTPWNNPFAPNIVYFNNGIPPTMYFNNGIPPTHLTLAPSTC
jgi:hypothetical protein